MTEIEKRFVRDIDYHGTDDLGIERYEEYLDSIKRILAVHNYEYEILEDAIIIKFSDFVCKDLYGNTTNIYEPYVKINTSKLINIRRMKFSALQFVTNYLHSHVGTAGSGLLDWSSQICYGSNIAKHSFLETLINVLFFYPVFLSEESSATNPYQLMSDLNIGGLPITSPVCITNYSPFIEAIKIKIKNFYGLQILVAEIDDNDLFDKHLIAANAISYKINNVFYQTIRLQDTLDHEINTNFVFKGESQSVKIVTDNIVLPQKQPCGLTRTAILTKINNYINEPSFFQSQANTDNTGQD